MSDNSDFKMKTINITMDVPGDHAILHVRGDFHYGVKGVDINEGGRILKERQDTNRGKIFVMDTGDLHENNINGSVGHGYDVDVKDPQNQVETIIKFQKELNEHLYGKDKFRKLNIKNLDEIRHVGVIGNHEYRTRKTAGLWLNRSLYGEGKILDLGISSLVRLTIKNKKAKISKTYTIYVSHRPNKSDATSIEGIVRASRAKKAEVEADIYAYGHYHRRMIIPDQFYTSDGVFKKVLYVVNPSPMHNVEYSDWAGYNPIHTGWYVECQLPIDSDAFGIV